MTDADVSAILADGLALHQAGHLAEAEAIYRQVLAANPASAGALHLLGTLASQVGRHDAAIDLISQAVQIDPTAASFHTNLGVAHHSLGHLDEAVAAYERALALAPDNLDALYNRGLALQALGRIEDALDSFEGALALRPDHAATLSNAGALYLALGRLDESEACLRHALALRPDYVAALTNLAGVLLERGQLDEALAAGEQAVTLAPAEARTHTMLGTILRDTGRLEDAIASYEQALTLSPDAAGTWLNLGGALQSAGRPAPAADAFRRALELNPASSNAHSGLIFTLDLLPGMAAEARTERQRWNARFRQARRSGPARHPNSPDPKRPLRVGYVSADFRQHSASLTFMPILRAHHRGQVQIACYSGVTRPDAITEEARGLADVWRDVGHLSDDALEALIRADQIDILVDLSGHSAGNRLPVFAREPAPIQVTAWGYATGTGLDTMHYFLADSVVVPPEARASYAEEVVNLPSVVCYAAPPFAPPVAPAPTLERGHATFGAFNRLPKISDETVATWAAVLAAVPNARFVIKSVGLEHAAMRAGLLERLGANGVALERVTLLGGSPQAEHLAAHAEIDLMLDSFPHTGGMTTLEALLMGVPVVTLLGEGVAGRLSASFLTALGLEDLIAETTDAYVAIARRLANDPGRLAAERATLRERLLASPIGDTRAYTRAVEAAYRELWRRWCSR